MKKLLLISVTVLTVLAMLFAFAACGNTDKPDTEHTHSFADSWAHDADSHWHECTAGDGETSDKAPHSWDGGTVSKQPTATADGVKTYTCTVCGATKNETLHDFGSFIEETAATCTTDGTVAHYHCGACGKDFDAAYNEITAVSVPALGHDHTLKSLDMPSLSGDGQATYVCSRNGCGDTEVKKILQLPTVTLTESRVMWNAVPNAAGYIICTGSTEVDAGPATSYPLTSLTNMGDTITVRAYPAKTNEEYVDMDTYKTVVALRATGSNAQALLGGDFELPVDEYVVPASNGWGQYPYGNWSQGAYYIVRDGDNMCGKIVASTWYPGCTKLQKDLSNAVCKAGSYRLSFDVKLSAAAKNNFATDANGKRYGHIDVGLWTGLETYISLDTSRNNLQKANCDTWTTFTFDFTLPTDCGNFMHLCVTYWPEIALTDNYVLIDNIVVQRVENGSPVPGNIDTIPGGDFEQWKTDANSLTADSWLANNTILVEKSAAGSSLITEADGNSALKVNSTASTAVFNLAGNPSVLGKAGLYEMTFKLKKGTGLNATGFGIEMWGWANGGDAFALVDRVSVDISGANDKEYTEYKVRFVSKGLANCNWVNICCKVEGGAAGAESYIIIDDVSIYAVDTKEAETMNILMIGNSFMDDTIEYVHRIADNVNYDKEINLYGLFIGGCNIDTHWNNFENKQRTYDLRKWNPAGNRWDTVASVSIQQALNLHDKWDYVSFQQSSTGSGQASSFTHLKELTDGVRAIVGEETDFIWLGTWAYTTAYGTAALTSDMAPYNMDQMTMYNAILTQIKRITEEENIYGFVKMVPSGTAVQNMRTAFDDKEISRDERHLSFGIGRFTSSMTFAAKVLGIDITQVTYRPSSMTDAQLKQVIEAVSNALETPYQVTPLA